MLLPLLPLAVALVSAASADTTRFIVSNHGREAGDLVVVRDADSVVVRWVFTDRNRGTRLELRSHLDAKGNLVRGDTRPVNADGSAGLPTDAIEVGAEGLDVYNSMLAAMGASRRLGPSARPVNRVDRIRL